MAEMKDLLTDEEAVEVVRDYRRILELNGHKPTTADSRHAIAQAQLAKDKARFKEALEELRKENERLDRELPPASGKIRNFTLKHRSRPELREKMGKMIAMVWAGKTADDATQLALNIAEQIDALYPDEEEIREQIEVLKGEITQLNKKLDDREFDLIDAKREERERIIKYLDEATDTRDLDKRLQVLKGE